MTIRNIGNALLSGLSTDTKPTTYPTDSIFIETNTGSIYVYNGTSWVLKSGAAGDVYLTAVQTLTNKTISATNNTITDSPISLGDLLISNGSKFVRRQKGSALQVYRTNATATDTEWATLDSERVGKSVASGNNSTTVFNIAHGLGSNPTYAFVSVAQAGSAATQPNRSYTTDATNIIVTFSAPPTTGTNNVVIYWRVVA